MHPADDHAARFRDAPRLRPGAGLQGVVGVRAAALGTPAPDERFAQVVPGDVDVLISGSRPRVAKPEATRRRAENALISAVHPPAARSRSASSAPRSAPT